MPIITVRIDDKMKRMMDELRYINWSEVIRDAIARKIEEEMKRKIDRRRLLWASTVTESLRRRGVSWSSVEEIRRWRESR
ncbi:MAG TPA: hypothetical protein EYH44_03895 [Thermoprotei archaeon]|nr:hypothetical protein [Thermoprotei archaeon]